MNLLEMTNRLKIEVGASGSDLTTVQSLSGESRRLANWIIQSDLEIQELHYDWRFLRTAVSFNTIASQASYAPDVAPASLTNFAEWKEDSFRVYLTSAGYGSETFMPHLDYDTFRDTYQYNARRATYARPVQISVGPDKKLWLGPGPNDIYTIVGEYFKSPTSMSADADTSVIPTRFHMAIVYKAMTKYATFESAPEVLEAGTRGYREQLAALTVNQLPELMTGGPLA